MKVKEITSNDLEKTRAARAGFMAELEQLRVQEAAVIAQGGADLLEGKANGSYQALADLRSRREFLESALNQANERIRSIEQDLLDLRAGEAVQAWRDYEESFWGGLEKIQEAIGENGLNGQVAELREAMESARAAYNAGISSGQPPENYSSILGTLSNLTNSLFEAWRNIDAMNAYNPKRRIRPESTQEGHITGFGKLWTRF